MYCMKCGAQNDEGLRFCTKCGAPLDEAIEPSQEPIDYRPSDAPRRKLPGAVIAGIALSFLAVAVVLAFVFLHPLDLLFPKEEPKRVEPPIEKVSSNGDEDKDDSSSKQEEEEENATPTVRASLSEYSWKELSAIADEIAACKSRDDAVKVAESYKLCGANGKMFSSSKEVKLSDGTTISFQIVDVYHDETAAGGKAGLTFLATGICSHHRMAGGTTMPGGWEGSEMRSWLRTDVLPALPTELSDVIKPVLKKSNNEGKTDSSSAVSETTDSLWLPSIVELVGHVNWEYSTDPSRADYFNSVFNAEGYEYAAFEQAGMNTEGPNSALAIGGDWWMRSSAASTGRGRYVGKDGSPDKFGDSNQSLGVLFGFCL